MNFEEIGNWTILVQGLVKLGWEFKFYDHSHPLGIVPCIELSREEDCKAEFRTFYSTDEVYKWRFING